MVKVVRMTSPGNYNHLSENHRDAIFGTSGHDVIVGDDETFYTSWSGPIYDDPQIISPSKGNWGKWKDLGSLLIISNPEDEFAAVKVNMDGAKPIAIDEYIDGGGDWDIIHGLNGNDWLVGGAGDDFLWGGNDHDVLMGGADNDFLDTGTGLDSANGGDGNDTVNNIDAGGGDFSTAAPATTSCGSRPAAVSRLTW